MPQFLVLLALACCLAPAAQADTQLDRLAEKRHLVPVLMDTSASHTPLHLSNLDAPSVRWHGGTLLPALRGMDGATVTPTEAPTVAYILAPIPDACSSNNDAGGHGGDHGGDHDDDHGHKGH
jgi:hypothetical protein